MQALVERFGDRIWLKTSAPTPGLSQKIKGATWRKNDRCWSLPLRLDVCKMLREEFGKPMQIGPILTKWAKQETSKERTLTGLGSTLQAVELHRVPSRYPALAKALANRPYQSVAARFIEQGRNVLLGDTPGLGKTIEAIAGIVEADVPGPYLVICPVGVMDDAWSRALQRWLPDQNVYVARGSRDARAKIAAKATGANDWVVINHDMLRTVSWWVCKGDHSAILHDLHRLNFGRAKSMKCEATSEGWLRWRASDKPKSATINCGHLQSSVKTVHEHMQPGLFEHSWGATIMDESHMALIRLSGTPTQVRNGARMLQVREDGLRIAASGTPMRGKAVQLWGTLNWLRPKEFTGFWSWAASYYEIIVDHRYGSRSIGGLLPSRRAILDQSLSGIMLRRTKAEVSPELPPKQYMGEPLNPRDPASPIAVWLEMLPQQARAYAEMSRSGIAEVNGGQLTTVGILAEMTRLQQFSSAYGEVDAKGKFRATLPSNKYDWLEQFLRELGIVDGDGTGDSKVVVVSRWTSTLRIFAEALMEQGVEVCGITGAITGKKRQAVVDAFNAKGGPRVLFLNTKAGGVGITLDSADDMVFLDQTHRPDDQEQAEDRINNRRPEERVATRRYWYLRSIGTVDEAIAVVNDDLDREQKGLLDERRGVAYSRAVFDYLEAKVA